MPLWAVATSDSTVLFGAVEIEIAGDWVFVTSITAPPPPAPPRLPAPPVLAGAPAPAVPPDPPAPPAPPA